jgi:hypothetical protein
LIIQSFYLMFIYVIIYGFIDALIYGFSTDLFTYLCKELREKNVHPAVLLRLAHGILKHIHVLPMAKCNWKFAK